MTILGPDVSHYQGFPNWSQVKASGRDYCVIKATEGTTYVDPSFAVNRKAAHGAGLIVLMYAFGRAGDPAAEAAWFLRTVGPLQPGEVPVLDWEVAAANPPAWCEAWLDAVYAATGVRGIIYMNRSTLYASDWTRVASSYALWLAVYDGTLTFPAVPYWGTPAMKQYSDAGTVPGVAGPCDVNVFNGTRDQLLAFGTPTPQENDMTPDQAAALNEIRGYMQNVAPAVGRVEDMLRGDDPVHDNIWLIWAALYGQSPVGNDNVLVKALAEVAAVMKTLQAGGVDPAEVAKLVLTGLNGASLSVTTPPAPAV